MAVPHLRRNGSPEQVAMSQKFNFLARRTASVKAEQELRRQFPRRSSAWISAKAAKVAGNSDITSELRAQTRAEVK